ncbi:MAG: BamA/TamA family outer membrane protein [Proteobacteria bacterium]|nr:BamA/TamA family outer membrane protein [Pseudomonadota bacterium]
MALLAALPATVATRAGVRAADPQPYATEIAPSGNAALDQALRDASTLVSLQTAGPVGPFGLIARARQDVPRLQAVLGSFGYYKGSATVRIDGRALDDPGLFDRIENAPKDPPLPVTVAIETGPAFHLGKVAIEGDPPAVAREALRLDPGQPALAADVLAARERMLTALRDAGYALAKAPEPVATLRADQDALDVAFPVDAGPRMDIGPIAIDGLERVNPGFARRQLTVAPGEQFSPALVEKGRQELMGLGVFSSVRAIAGTAPDAAGGLPITYQVSERKRHQVNATIAYSTDLGAEGSVSWLDRNLFGNAEQLRLTAGMSLGGTAQPKPGYAVAAQFIKPSFPWRDTSLQADLGAVDQSLQAYDRKAVTGDILLNYKPSPHWTFSAGVNGEQSQITQEGMTDNYTLFGLPLVARYDSTDSVFDPTHGVRVAALVTPTQSVAGKPGTFVLSQLTGSAYVDVSALWDQPGRSVLALRGLIGKAFGVGQFGLPPDQRFYAGGSSTVRGYKFQTVGPLFPDGNPEGGTAISAGTIEWRQRFLQNWGFALFADAGQVTADGAPFGGTWSVGVGGGLRYYTAIGPIRVDVAFPVQQTSASGSFQLYIGIGQAF